jgi:hydrogenase maturation protease
VSRLVIGLGNPYRGDDAAGIAVTARLHRCQVVQSLTGSFELIDAWAGFDEVVIVDATVSNEEPGTVLRFDAVRQPLPAGTFASAHTIGVAETVEMARTLGRLPERMVVYGIEAGDLSEGTSMSPAVAEAVERVAEEIDHA